MKLLLDTRQERYYLGPASATWTHQEVQNMMFRELMPAMVTPFDKRGEVDLEATEVVVERFIDAGVDGIAPLGSTGEERKRFAEEVVRIVNGRVPLVVGVA